MNRLRSICFLLSLALAGALQAEICSLDTVPAATLLLPYFDVDLDDPQGRTTLMSIANASDRAVLAHVVLWTDAGLPTLAFDVYLTGFDVQTLNLRDIFEGRLPATADLARDPADAVSPKGEHSQDATFPGCETLLPPASLTPQLKEHLQKAHLGQRTPLTDNVCLGLPTQGQMARGYVTVDVVRRCSNLMPGDQGYFGPDGVVAHDNVLWGDFFYVEPGQKYSQGENLVRIESDPSRFTPGDSTFYGRFVRQTGIDGREPLPTSWGSRYLSGGIFSGGTDLIVWREPTQASEPFLCGREPVWHPLTQETLFMFDEAEAVDAPACFFPVCSFFTPFTAVSGRYRVDGEALPVPFEFGWLFTSLRPSAQSWMGSVSSASGVFSVGFNATPFDDPCSDTADRQP